MSTPDAPVALVTGGARGIGRAIVATLAEAGYRVGLADRLADAGATAAREMRAQGHEVIFYETDVRSAASVRETVGRLVREHGRMDLAVNNAGVRAVAPVADLDEDDWARVVDVNLTGVFRCMKYEIPPLLAVAGSIVNITSIWGLVGWPGRSAYVAAKHGVVGLTRSAAREYGRDGLRVNAVAPGPIETEAAVATVSGPSQERQRLLDRTAVGRFGRPTDVSDAVLWLATARFVTGEVLAGDGGWGA